MPLATRLEPHAAILASSRRTYWRFSVPALVGIVDSASFLMYLFAIPELPFYATLLSIKVALPAIARVDLAAARPALPFAILVFLAVLVSTIANDIEPLAVYKALAVLASLMLTLILIDRSIREYALGVSISGAVICILYLVQVRQGVIGDHFGRLYFFGDNHPNLGGEILGIVVIMSALCLKPRLYFALAGAAGYCVWLMQSRSGLLAILVSTLVYVPTYVAGAYGWRRCLIIAACFAFAFTVAVLAGVATGSPLAITISDLFWNTLFLADDEYRGAGTGLTGRDHHWAETIRIFSEHPLFGAGLEYQSRLDVIQPHNWFLYAMAQFGVLGIFVIIAFLAALARGMLGGLSNTLALLPLAALLIFNDRFLNFNIYPLGMYVLVFALARRPMLSSSWTPYAKFSNARIQLVRTLPS